MKYLVCWKGFIAKNNTWERKEDLENTKEVVADFKKRMNVKVTKQERLKVAEKWDFRWEELLEKYIVKMLYGWSNKKFEREYLRKLERNWQKWKFVSLEEKPWKGSNVRMLHPMFWSYLCLPIYNYHSSSVPLDPFQCESKLAMSSNILASTKQLYGYSSLDIQQKSIGNKITCLAAISQIAILNILTSI